jgi:hypothetical protein
MQEVVKVESLSDDGLVTSLQSMALGEADTLEGSWVSSKMFDTTITYWHRLLV